ncbi:MAG: hypothetical protein ABIN97_06840 [Ginsengibacter sp.]
MIKLITLWIVLLFSFPVFGQFEIYDEEFNLNFLKIKDGGQWFFKGNNHSFSINIIAKNITTTESPNYITADNTILQVSIVPLPKSNLDLSKLTIAQQKETLAGYVDYELDYFKNDVKINYKDLKKEWVTVNSILWLIWSFDSRDFNSPEPVKGKPQFQIYASTICFNQILDLNTPVMKDQSFYQSKSLISRLMATLKL